MSYFYLSAIVIVLVAVLFVCFPILKKKWRNNASSANTTELSNANVIKQRMLELEVEVNEGLIDAGEKDNAVRDLKLALADESPLQSSKDVQGSKPMLLILIAIPAIIIGAWVYWQANQLEGLQTYKSSALEVADIRKKLEEQGPQSLTPDDFAKFALSIRSGLRENPDDARGWSFLAMVNTSIGRVDEGIAAYKKALDLTPADDALRFKFAEALMLQGSEESLQNSAYQLDYLIRKQPEDRNNRLLLTSVAIQLQNPELAVSQFALIKNDMNPSSQFYQTIVAELRKLGVDDVSIVGEPLAASARTSSGEQKASSTESQASTDRKNNSEVLVTVTISDELQSNLPDSAYLIVFAQHSDLRSRAPLAVKRFSLAQLPVQVVLSDADAMIPSMNLSSAQAVNITARISFDEDVMPSAGELEGSTKNISIADINSSSENNKVNVVIDSVLK